MTPSAATGLIGTGKRILVLPHIRRAYRLAIVPRHYIRSLQGYFSCAVLSVYSLTAMEVRLTTVRSCPGGRSPAKGRDDNCGLYA